MTSTFLEQTMEDDSSNTLGINCERGKLYLAKNVSASQFRDWSISAIQRIIPLITEEARIDDFENFKARNVIDRHDWKCSPDQASVFEQIVYGVYNSIRRGHGNAYINLEIDQTWSKTQKYWIARHVAECPSCGEHTYLRCSYCHSPNVQINKSGQLFCKSCGEIIDRCQCDEGHEFSVPNPYDTLRLLPTAETLYLVSKVVNDSLLMPFDKTFQITGNRVEIYPLHTPMLVNTAEIPELKQVLDIDLSKEEYEEMHKKLMKIKEKCRTSNNDNCNKCLLSHERSCLMKVFATHHSYRPSPHNGDEFGDVSFPVTIDGHTVTLVGVIKSALAKNANLTRSSTPAREMFQQIFSMCQDSRVGLIAAICPSRFQDQFYEDLQYLSKLTQKPVVVLDDFYMCKQYKAAIEENIIS